MKKSILFFTAFVIGFLPCTIAQPSIQWQKCLGGSADDAVYSTISTNDGGYIMTGETNSLNGDVSGFHVGGDRKSVV